MQDDASAREAFNVLTDEEVKESINDAIENIGQNIKVIFRSKKCQDCGQIGDERLLSKYCHMQSTWIHTGISENCHPGFTEPYHRHVYNRCGHVVRDFESEANYIMHDYSLFLNHLQIQEEI